MPILHVVYCSLNTNFNSIRINLICYYVIIMFIIVRKHMLSCLSMHDPRCLGNVFTIRYRFEFTDGLSLK